MPPMAQSSSSPFAPLRSVDEIRQAVRSLLPGIRARAAACERARMVSAETFEALRAVGFYKLVQPAAFGGYEQDFAVLIELIMKMAAACASTAWVCGLLSAHQWMVGLYPRKAQEEVWVNNPGATFCGSYAPINEARTAAAGYRSERTLVIRQRLRQFRLGDLRRAHSSEQPAARVPGVPARAGNRLCHRLHLGRHRPRRDRQQDAGAQRCVCPGVSPDLVCRRRLGGAHRAANCTPVGSTPCRSTVISPRLAATAVGRCRLAHVEDFIDGTSGRLTRGSVTGSNNRMAEFPTIQIKVAEAAASVDAARTILLRDLQATADEVRQKGEALVTQRVTNRRGQVFAVKLAVQAADILNGATGGNGLALSNPVQRAWRDVNAVARHVCPTGMLVSAMYGQMALGLEPRGQY